MNKIDCAQFGYFIYSVRGGDASTACVCALWLAIWGELTITRVYSDYSVVCVSRCVFNTVFANAEHCQNRLVWLKHAC